MSLKDTTTDLNTLRALLERVEGATGELPHGEAQALVGACQFDPDAAYLLMVAITDAPLNATGYALAFHEAVLPGWYIRMSCDPEDNPKYYCGAATQEWAYYEAPEEFGGGSQHHVSLPLAIIAADLRALIAKAEGAENGTI